MIFYTNYKGDVELKNKKTVIMGIIIGVLVVVIAVMGYFLISGSGKNGDDGSDTGKLSEDASVVDTTASGGDTQAEKTDTPADEKAESEKTEQTDEEREFYVEIGHESTWETDGKTCATENINIYNDTSAGASGWKLEIEYKGKPVIDQIWNGEQKTTGNTIIITPASYNGEIPANGSINVGYNISSDDLAIGKYILYVNGKEYTGDPAVGSSKEEQSMNSKKTDTGSVTEADNTEVKAAKPVVTETGTPYDNHGKLSVNGTDIVDKDGNKYQLKGVSTHGITWFPEYVNKDAFASVRDDWGANLIRLAMYTDTGDSNGYCSGGDKDSIRSIVDSGVSAATELGMYVIIDWHILNDGDPNIHIDDAEQFFADMSVKYADYGNVIYEICNEPNGGTTWDSVKKYAEQIIPVIRKNAKDAIIIVGTPNWSQDVDIAADAPVEGYDNIMYAVHFYAATHKDDIRGKVETAIQKGLPVFVSEFSLCDASGNGGIDYDSSDAWFKLINENNLSYASWSLCNKNETSALLKPDLAATGSISESDLSETGLYVRDKVLGN